MSVALEGEAPLIFDFEQDEPAPAEGHSSPGHFLRGAGRLACYGLIGVGIGVGSTTMDGTETELGPHDVEIKTTLDSTATIDFGPLGSIELQLDDTSTAGVNIVVKKYNGGGLDPDPTTFTEDDLEPYIRFLTNPEPNVEHAAKDVASTAGRNGFFAGLAVAGYDNRRRRRAAERADDPQDGVRKAWRALAVATVIPAIACNYGVPTTPDTDDGTVLGPAYNDTPLEGAVVHGPLEGLMGKYGEEVLGRIRANREFYDKVEANLEQALADAILLPGTGETMIFATDLHCNVGMAQIAGRATELTNATIYASGGDDTMTGSVAEGESCIRVLGGAVNGVEEVAAAGNHDSDITNQYLADQGFVNMDGTVKNVNGVRILGEKDPRHSGAGTGLEQVGDRTPRQIGDDLHTIACAADADVDVVLVHEPAAAESIIKDGCADLALSGHTHQEGIFRNTSGTLQIVGESAGGVKEDKLTVDQIFEPAVIYEIKLDPIAKKPTFYRTITVELDGSVEVGRPVYVLDMPQTDAVYNRDKVH